MVDRCIKSKITQNIPNISNKSLSTALRMVLSINTVNTAFWTMSSALEISYDNALYKLMLYTLFYLLTYLLTITKYLIVASKHTRMSRRRHSVRITELFECIMYADIISGGIPLCGTRINSVSDCVTRAWALYKFCNNNNYNDDDETRFRNPRQYFVPHFGTRL